MPSIWINQEHAPDFYLNIMISSDSFVFGPIFLLFSIDSPPVENISQL